MSIYRDVWLETYPNEELGITRKDLKEKFQNWDQLIQEWKQYILNDQNRGYWIVQKKDETLCGFCIAKKGEQENELEYIYLLPDIQKKGIGEILMNKGLQWLGETKPVVLYGAAYNDRAIGFYKKFGFTLSDEHIQPKILPNAKQILSIKMVKRFS